MNELSFEFGWVPVTTMAGPYVYPTAISPYIKDLYCKPAIYRWTIKSPDGKVQAAYYGECKNLINRLNGYLRPSAGTERSRGQLTNLRLKALFLEKIGLGSTVSLEILQFRPFRINNLSVTPESLVDPAMRKLIENIVIVLHPRLSGELLNKLAHLRSLEVLPPVSSSGITNSSVRKSDGVIASIIALLNDAKRDGTYLSQEEIVRALAAKFPDRDASGMEITVRAQLSRLPRERGFPIAKIKMGRSVKYAAN
jgi:hypothetical protein